MPRNPKLFIHNTLVELSSRTQEGLPFPPSRLMILILGNIVARAQEKYPLTISSLCIMPNHFHILAIVHSPEDVSNFVEYFKRESANAINRLLGRRQHSVWTTGYNSPIILDPDKALERLSYSYLNPVTAGLVPQSQDWQLSSASWVDFSSKVTERKFKIIPRDKIPTLPDRPLTIAEIDQICDSLEALEDTGYATLKIEPYAWKRCFAESKDKSSLELHKKLFDGIRQEEAKIQEEKGDTFPSLRNLQTRDIRTPYKPTKFSNRTISMSCYADRRSKYQSWAKGEEKKLPAYQKKETGYYSPDMTYPPGFFAPGGIMFASLLPEHTPISYFS